jgi:hypothetical protein
MEIAIIGGGWVGCHLAYKLMDKHSVTIYEKNDTLFSETSYKNQNRLHIGYHYARSFKTREMCRTTYDVFMREYGFVTKEVINNIYCVPKNDSLIDFKTYCKIFDGFDYQLCQPPTELTDGALITNERFIDHRVASEFFNQKLGHLKKIKKINQTDLKQISEDYEIVIDATNNTLKKTLLDDEFYELTISLLYKEIKKPLFGSVTLVDGKFFSIYPYGDNLYTLTDVEHTPIKKFKLFDDLKKYEKNITNDEIMTIKQKMEDRVIRYLPDFNQYFTYYGHFLSVKSKIDNSSDDRSPVIKKDGNIVSCFTGKIQGIYIIEDYINNLINYDEKRIKNLIQPLFT